MQYIDTYLTVINKRSCPTQQQQLFSLSFSVRWHTSVPTLIVLSSAHLLLCVRFSGYTRKVSIELSTGQKCLHKVTFYACIQVEICCCTDGVDSELRNKTVPRDACDSATTE